jgi:hypothetical protein
LELAKTLWNAVANNEDQVDEKLSKKKIRLHLKSAEAKLNCVAKSDREVNWGLEVQQLSRVLDQTGFVDT